MDFDPTRKSHSFFVVVVVVVVFQFQSATTSTGVVRSKFLLPNRAVCRNFAGGDFGYFKRNGNSFGILRGRDLTHGGWGQMPHLPSPP